MDQGVPAVIDERGLLVASDLARIARQPAAPAAKLAEALELLFRAYGSGDPDFSGLMLRGWIAAREDKHCRLRLAWQREQLRLSLEDILTEGVASGAVKAGLDPGAVAALIVGAAEAALLQAPTDGGSVTADDLARALLALVLSGA